MGFLAILSLGLLIFAGVSLAFSVPVDDKDVGSVTFGGHGPVAGSRAVVVPVSYASQMSPVSTFATGGDGYANTPGALLAIGNSGGLFPTTSTNVSFARALMFMSGAAAENDTILLEQVPMRDADGNETLGNLTLNLSTFPALTPGFIVKADSESEPRFVPTANVIGEAARFDAPGRMVTFLMVGIAGFVVPVIGLITTHGRTGKPGAAGHGLCRECQGVLTPPSDFCLRCGAIQPK